MLISLEIKNNDLDILSYLGTLLSSISGLVSRFIASLLRREGKQAIKNKTDKQSINFKEGAIKCFKEIKNTGHPNKA